MRAGARCKVGRCPLCRPYAGEKKARERRALDLARSSLWPWPWGWGRKKQENPRLLKGEEVMCGLLSARLLVVSMINWHEL